MHDVEILVIVMSTRPYYMTYLSQEFFNYIFAENLSETCRHVVIRITKDEDSGTASTDRQSRRSRSWRLRSERTVDPTKVMKTYGFEMEKIKAKASKFVKILTYQGYQKAACLIQCMEPLIDYYGHSWDQMKCHTYHSFVRIPRC